MQANLTVIIFIISSLFMGIFGFLIHCVESYLPVFIVRSFRYGKFSTNANQPVVAKLEVPKKWFQHFYMFSAPTSSYVLYLVLSKYLWNVDVPKYFLCILNIWLGTSRKPQVMPEDTFVAISLLTLHCWKRLYEVLCVNIFSDKKMNISHYIIGFIHYIGTILSLVGESVGFVEGSEAKFSWNRITNFHLLCAVIFISSSFAQLNTNIILKQLRKDKTGEINSKVYKIPHGGLFEYVSGALQITEIIIYITLSVIVWQSYTFHYITAWVISNQIATAALTHTWYLQTFSNYPKSRKILIPYLF